MTFTCIGFLVAFHCVSNEPPQSHAAFCDVYQPVIWHANDTRGTKEQVDVLNRQWKRLCRQK